MKKLKYLSLGLIVVAAGACTKLDEKLRDRLSFEDPNVNATGLLQGAYESFNGVIQDQSRWWAAQQHTTDETVGPTRGGDWDDNGVWRVMHSHDWNGEHDYLNNTFRELLSAQFAATSVLEKNPSAQQGAEAKFLRSFSMWAVLDGWDQVPFRADLKNLKALPETKKGADAASFIISELEGAIGSLPEKDNAKPWTANKDAAKALLAKLYLNKGAYANRANPTFDAADMNKVIAYADELINSGRYSLTPNFYDNFAPTNTAKSKEMIWALENTDGVRGGNVRSMWFAMTHYNQNPSGWNGFTTLSDFYDKFEANDKRKGDSYTGVTDVTGLRVGFLLGQQYGPGGVALKDRQGKPLAFTREVALRESGSNLEVTGIRVIKYPPDLVHENPAENEYVIYRYADVLLMKAEAILRGGTATGGQTPLSIVNMIRARAGASAKSAVTLDDILDERGRELYYESTRRTDLIRFGKFLAPNQLKGQTDASKLLFAIPNDQVAQNPNLTQNPGY